MSACGRDRATAALAPGTSEGDALALLDAVADNLLRLLPESATSLGIDTGARAALRSQLVDRSADGEQRVAQQVRAELERVNAFNTSGLSHAVRTSVEVVRSAYTTALEGFALPYGDITGRRLAQHALRRHSECGRVSRHPALPGQRPSNRERRGRRGVSGPAAVVCEAARRRAWSHGGGAQRWGSCLPAFLIDKALGQLTLSVQSARDGGSLVDSIARRTNNIPGQLGRTGPAIAAQQIAPALERQIHELQEQRGRDGRCRHLGASPRRGVLPLGAQGLDHDDALAGRGARDRSRRARAAARADGRDPEADRLRAGVGGRTDASAGQGPALHVCRRRQGPRRDPGLHQRSARLDSAADAARVQPGGESEHGGASGSRPKKSRERRRRTAGPDRSTARSRVGSGSTSGPPTSIADTASPT